MDKRGFFKTATDGNPSSLWTSRARRHKLFVEGADVRPDFNWDGTVVGGMGYR
jgi:hypothetical protein